MCDLIQSLDAVEDIRVVPEISDVDRDLRGCGMELVDTRLPDHIAQLNRAEISSRRLSDRSSVDQRSKKSFKKQVIAVAVSVRILVRFKKFCHYSQTRPL